MEYDNPTVRSSAFRMDFQHRPGSQRVGTHSLRRTKATFIYRRTATYERYSCSSVTERSKALFDTLASRSTMPLLSQSRLTSERLGRAPSLALPTKHVRNWGNNGSSTDEPPSRQLIRVRHLQHQFVVMQNRESLLSGTRGGESRASHGVDGKSPPDPCGI